MLPNAYISHQTMGRLRVKIPSKKGAEGYFTSLKERLLGIEGVRTVETNPLTGSVLLVHGMDVRTIAEFAAANNLFSLQELNGYPAGLQQRISRTFKGMDAHLKTFTGGEIDIAGLAFLILLGAGIYQISMGNLTALPWYGAFWYALNILLKSSSVPS
ncbi:MAG: HMA2 domain-containing protein [Dissulfurispiraceae bacterium]